MGIHVHMFYDLQAKKQNSRKKSKNLYFYF